MITEQLRGLGSWQLRLAADTPSAVLNDLSLATRGFGLLVVTDVAVTSVIGHTSASLRAMARYVGVYRERNGFELGGVGPAVLLGDEDGKGEILSTKLAKAASNLNTWLTDLLPSNGITKGTVTSPGGTPSGEYQYVTRRAAIDAVCDAVGADWRINPDLTLDAAVPGTLFANYTTPKAIVTRRGTGRDLLPQIGVIPLELANITDLEDYSTKVYCIARQNGLTVGSASASSVPFFAPNGSALKMERIVDGAQTDIADASTVATQQVSRFSDLRQSVKLSTAEYDMPRKLRPGDRLWVYDPETGLADAANNVYYEGSVVAPLAVRCYGLTWGLRPGLGVYFLTPEATPRVIDLSHYYVPEDTVTQVEVGTPARAIGGGLFVPGLSPAGDVTLKTLDAWTLYTVTWTATGTAPAIGNGTLFGWVKRIGQTVHYRIRLNAGSTTTFGTGDWIFSPPVTAFELGPAGTSAILDTGVAWYHGTALLGSTTQLYLGRATGFAGQGTPVTLGNTDAIYLSGTYEAA